MFPVFQLTPLISMMVALFIFCMLMTCLIVKRSAKRTILLTTPLLERRERTGLTPTEVHPVYMWMVQPNEETKLKEGERYGPAREVFHISYFRNDFSIKDFTENNESEKEKLIDNFILQSFYREQL